MISKNNIYWLIGGIILTILVWNFIIGRREIVKTINKVDTLRVTKYTEKPVVIERLTAKLDTVQTLVRDTIYTPLITASAEKSFSLDSNVSFKVKYLFPPVNEFRFTDVKIKVKETFTTVTKEVVLTSFWDRFGYSIQAGFGQGLINKQFDVYVGIGVHFRIK